MPDKPNTTKLLITLRTDYLDAIDQIIQQAIQDGAFENLPGKGKPLNLDDNPHVDPE